MRLDLNHYGLIGFQKEWRSLQGETGKNLLERFVDDCINSGVDGCAVTSEEYKIPRGSVHDRFGILKKIALHQPTNLSFHKDELGPEYISYQVSDNHLVIEKNTKKIYLLNSQVARVRERDEKIAILIVGDNNFQDQQSFSDSIEYLSRNDVVVIPKKLTQHGSLPAHHSKATDVLLKYGKFYDAVIGYNAQQNRPLNEKFKEFSLMLQKPYVAISGKHSFSGCGTCIDINDPFISNDSKRFIGSLKSAISHGQFKPVEKQESLFSSLMWKALFVYGTRGQRHLNYRA